MRLPNVTYTTIHCDQQHGPGIPGLSDGKVATVWERRDAKGSGSYNVPLHTNHVIKHEQNEQTNV